MNIESLTVIKSLGSQRKRKTSEVFLVEKNYAQQKFILKTILKTNIKLELLNLIKQEEYLEIKELNLFKPVIWEENNDKIYILRPYLSGIPLDTYLDQLGTNLKKRRRFLIQFIPLIQHKLQILNQNKIAHCDLKPSNIILQIENEILVNIELIDFAFAHNYVTFSEHNTRPLIYSLGYSAPELLLNFPNLISSKTDYFSIGIVIYKILTDKLPLINPNPAVMTNLQLTHPVPEHHNLKNEQIKLLNQICLKPFFSTSPSKISKGEQNTLLKNSITGRMEFADFVSKFMKTLEKKTFWPKLFS